MKIRAATPDDEPAILALLQSSLGWLADENHAHFYRWKHVENPFGPSYGWVAVADERVIGLRLFMRWEFRLAQRVIRAVRAVDTATHPDYRGQGIFRKLTVHGLKELQRDGAAFVFNTPNDQSRPGYLSMGWQVVGRLPVQVRPRSLAAIRRLIRARVPAELSSVPTHVGLPARAALAERVSPGGLQDLQGPGPNGTSRRLTTNRTAEYLNWRYGHEPLAYRVFIPAGDAAMVVFRLRRRGPATEAVIADVLGDARPDHRGEAAQELWRAGADYFLALAQVRGLPRALTIPGLGPVLTIRPLASSAPTAIDGWGLSMGDVELM